MSSSQFGRSPAVVLVEIASPATTLHASRAQDTIPPDRATYHHSWFAAAAAITTGLRRS